MIEFLLSDEEIVRKIRYPEESVYLDEQFLAVADDLRNPLLEDKNMEALYKYPAPLAPEGRSRYEELAKSVVNEMLPQFLDSSQDVNSFLRELQEETERRIAEEQSRE